MLGGLLIKFIVEELDKMLKFTIDTSCNYDDGKIPVLDIKVNINEDMDYRIDYEFYEKPTKHPKVLLADSAISASSKRTILTQECLRRMRNTKIELGENVRNKYLNAFMVKLKNSGYNRKYRVEILDSAMKAFEKMLEEDRNGKKPLFRNKEWMREEREASKDDKKRNWYKDDKNSYKTVLFVPPTPGGVLTKELKKREQELNKNNSDRIKIIEKGGVKIESFLTKKNPFKKENCSVKLCPLCSNKNKEVKILCNTNNVGYRWVCNTCKNKNKTTVYEGESSRSARLRGKEHLMSYKNKKQDSVLYKHKILEHEEEEVEFEMEITGVFQDALSRQADEAVRIQSRKSSELMNSKSQFNHPPIARIIVEKTNKYKPQYSDKRAQLSPGL